MLNNTLLFYTQKTIFAYKGYMAVFAGKDKWHFFVL